MYRSTENQLEFENFGLPFSGNLRSDNRWVKLAKLIPWSTFELSYSKTLKRSGFGPPAKSVRVALGALIIKERLGTSDEETVEQIRENPYLQYFLGFKEYRDEEPFHPTMFVHFRKRISKEMLCKVNEAIHKKAQPFDDDDDPSPGNKGKLLIDATCAPADITFPTDLKLLNKAREKSEKVIDILHKPYKGKKKKPRTYRRKARKDFLRVAKAKALSKSKRRKAIRKQLGYVERNLKTISRLTNKSSLSLLTGQQYKQLLVISELLRQQRRMYEQHANRINDRIVSISQPHVRPIKRGKAHASTEFGAKISASLVEGYCFLDRLSWDNYNESGDLENQIQLYKKRYGFYPKSVHVDKIYRNRDNIKFCKKYGIRMSGPRLGRPPKDLSKKQELKKQYWQDEIDRIPIEGKFGHAKRRFGLSRIMCKLARTSETAIAMTFLVMNLEKWLKVFLFIFSNWIKSSFCSIYVETKAKLATKNNLQMQIIELA
jgi:transposase, IS5 family